MEKKLAALRGALAELAPGGLLVAFSGGVDSALLLKLACETGGAVHAVTIYTLFHSPLEPEEAAATAASCGAEHFILTPALPEEILQNPLDRCYLCKKALFSGILAHGEAHGLRHVVDGTNADDLKQYRPGLRALEELGVRSPLAGLGITKAEVRSMAAALGLQVAAKPSAPCLATRYPYGQRIDTSRLPGIDRVEQEVRSLGIGVVRARVDGDTLRLEILPQDFPRLLEARERVIGSALDAGFAGISLDLEGFRSGSMDIRRERISGKAGAASL